MHLKTVHESATEKQITWHVAGKKYRIMHLLEDGHNIFVGRAEEKKGKRQGTVQNHKKGGNVRAFPHIRKNEEAAHKNFDKRVAEVIRRNGD